MENDENTQDNTRPSYKGYYEDCKSDLQKKEEKISQLERAVLDKDSKITELKKESEEWEETARIDQTQIEELEREIKAKDKTIKENELRRFSAAYSKQEHEFAQNQEKWFQYSLLSTLFLVLSVAFTIVSPSKGWVTASWYEQPGLYLLNAIFLTLFVYSIKQHSYYGHLRVDFANRKTLAQSYQHIIEDKEDAQIEKGFLAEVVKIFASPPTNEKESVSFWEYLLKRKSQ